MEIQNKVALVTGAGSGIGRASALRLAADGAAVVIAEIDRDSGLETVAQIGAAAGRAAFVQTDVTDVEDAQAMIEFAEETFGGLDILHNNAGILTRQPPYPEAPPEQWSRVVEINLRGVILGTQLGIASMRERGGGTIVNTASISAYSGWAADPVYAATKAGVMMFTASLATLKEELGIRVNCVCPAIVDTPMLHRARDEAEPGSDLAAFVQVISQMPLISPEDVAGAIVELIRDDSLAGRAMIMRNGMPRELAPLVNVPGA